MNIITFCPFYCKKGYECDFASGFVEGYPPKGMIPLEDSSEVSSSEYRSEDFTDCSGSLSKYSYESSSAGPMTAEGDIDRSAVSSPTLSSSKISGKGRSEFSHDSGFCSPMY